MARSLAAWLLYVAAAVVLAGTAAGLRGPSTKISSPTTQLLPPNIPQLYVRGSPYEAGLTVGQTFADRIRSFIATYPGFKETLLPFYNTAAGKAVFNQFVEANTKAYPAYMEELRGKADGAGVELYELQLFALIDEMFAAKAQLAGTTMPIAPGELSCSDVHVLTEDQFLLAHNEDAFGLVNTTAFFVTAVTDNTSYTAYTYPAMPAGMSFGFNSHGIAVTTNALFPSTVVLGGLGRYFVNRDVLEAVSLDDAIRRSTVKGTAYGWSTNIASMKERRLVNIEIAHSEFSILEVGVSTPSPYYHFNNYRHLNVSFTSDESSVRRLAAASALPPAACDLSARRILGDQSDKQYPIYRDSTPPDGCSTLATAVYDLNEGTFTVYTANPFSSLPLLRLRM